MRQNSLFKQVSLSVHWEINMNIQRKKINNETMPAFLSYKKVKMETSHVQRRKEGFTLVETLVAIFILVLAVILPLSASYIGISQAFQARDQLIASYLAQDAIEYIRKEINTNVRSGDNPLQTLTSCNGAAPPSGSMCAVDTVNDRELVDETAF